MKNFKKKLPVFLIIFGLGFISCTSDTTQENQEPDTYIRFTINGTNYEFINIATVSSESITFNGNNGADINEVGDTKITLWVPLTIENGTYNIESGQNATHRLSFTSASLNFDFNFANSGTLTISQVTDEIVVGTFSAIVTNDNDATITIENGSFKALSI